VILAGGEGTRLWPLAGPDHPKPFLALDHGRSLFQRTLERVAPLVEPEHVLVVAGRPHARWIRRQAPGLPVRNVLLESMGRNTAASVALAATWILSRHADAVMVVLPSDHWIAPASAFRASMVLGIAAARVTDKLVLVGVPVRSPDTGFGYIRPGRREVRPGVRAVSRFIEKPPVSVARRMSRSGRYLWNSGMFIWRAVVIRDELRRHQPAVIRSAEKWARGDGSSTRAVPASVLRKMPALPIDRAVLERSSNVAVVKAQFSWSDVGNWDAFGRFLARGRDANVGIGRLLTQGSSRCLSVNARGLTVIIGLGDVAVVRSRDAVLVCHRSAAQEVRRVVARLRRPAGGRR
jgi:mannose-1-phosphate guanylyltransferase